MSMLLYSLCNNALHCTLEPIYSGFYLKARGIIYISPSNTITLSKFAPVSYISFTMSESVLRVVDELTYIIETQLGAKKDFEDAITSAMDPKTGARDQMKTYGITSLDGFYKYLRDFLLWVPYENTTGTEPYVRMCLMYFVFEQPSVRKYQTQLLPKNARLTRDQLSPISRWLVKFAKLQGTFLSTPPSITPETLSTFKAVKGPHSYRVPDYVEPENGWKTFNDFFARQLKPGKRPIAGVGDNTIVASPADNRYGGSKPIEDDGTVVLDDINFKGIPWPIKDLIADTEVPDGTFNGGVLIHSFLAPYDYHRFHAPVSGTVVVSKVILAQVYLEVKGDGSKVVPIRRPYHRSKDPDDVEAPDDPGYQWCQTRGVLVLKTEKYGYVAAIPVGMCQISSVHMTANVGDKLTKGDEFGHFLFGGSDMVLLFEKKANFKYADEPNPKYLMGQKFGTLGV